MLPLHCFNVVVQFEFEFFKFEFKLNLFESLAKERKKKPLWAQTSPPAGPSNSPGPDQRPLSRGHRQVDPTSQGRLLPVDGADSSRSPAGARLLARLGPHAKARALAPYK